MFCIVIFNHITHVLVWWDTKYCSVGAEMEHVEPTCRTKGSPGVVLWWWMTAARVLVQL